MKAAVGVFGEGCGLGIAVNLNCLPRGVHDQAALLAFAEMLFDFRPKGRIEFRVKIIFKFDNNGLAVHR